MGSFFKSKNFDFIQAYEKMGDLWQELPVSKKRTRKKRVKRALKFFGYFGGTLLLFLIIALGVALVDLKQYYNYAIDGKSQLERAVQEMKAGDFSRAQVLAGKSAHNFYSVSERLRRLGSNPLVNLSDTLKYQLSNYTDLSESAFLISTSLKRVSLWGSDVKQILGEREISNFQDLDKREKEELLRLLYESLAEIRGVEVNLDLALWNLERMNTDLAFFPFSQKLRKGQKELAQKRKELGHLSQILSLLPHLAGYPDNSHFLVFFQNNDELRPTGGFLGTYGILETRAGEIERFDTHNIYHMDMPLEGEMFVEPPRPIAEYLNQNWYMRDANWSPDWPTTAKKLDWFYHKENHMLSPADRINDFQGEFDGVFAITPEFVSSLLAITGPVTVEGKQYKRDNFKELLQYQVERGYQSSNRSAWDRKEVVGKILQELKIKIFNLPSAQWSRVTSCLQDNLARKNILLYFNNRHYQDLVQDLDWAGRVKESPQDYLMVVDSNMGALKTDSVMERGIDYSLEQGLNGIFVDLNINYSQHGELSWKVSEYKSYTRVLVPRGSELLEVNRNNLGPENRAKVDTDTVKDKLSWGTYITLEPGEVGNLNLKYKLSPELEEKIKKTGRYVLLLQKQPGVNLKNSLIDISLTNRIKSYKPVGFSASLQDDNSVEWRSDITGDRRIMIDLENE